MKNFLYYLFWLVFLASDFKDDLYSLQRCSYSISNHSKWRRIEKDLPTCLVIGRQSMMGQYTLHIIRLTTNSDNSFWECVNLWLYPTQMLKIYFKIMWGIFYWPVHPSFKLWRIPLKTMRYMEGPMRSFWALTHFGCLLSNGDNGLRFGSGSWHSNMNQTHHFILGVLHQLWIYMY